jgi:uncharacterized protein (TIGR03086 family)
METKTDVLGAYGQAIEQARTVVAGVRPDQMANATPCPKWDTRALLNHLVGSNLMMAAAGSGRSMGEGTSGTEAVAALGDTVGDDPASAYRSASSSALEAFSAPGTLERIWKLPFGEVPGAAALNIHFTETVAHTWDLAKATGQLDKLDQDIAAAGETVARGFVQPEFRNEAGDPFGAEVAVPAGAPAYDRFAGFLGRTP